ncbi:VOC family protein [Rossellomorea sp. SC111]|uniref:VOC family protein n=1 Tax=Rossellomorea sp. SC111 TaxID=2968985 RepID=UPI00215AFB0F|nr:VOC family protein [Rossellomorea sp. SC111]MCR8847940.1 VOC family protein [Rossellomorea sp. SC111]
MFKIGSVFVPVTNLEKSSSWYEELLGVKKIGSWDGGAGFYLPNGSTQFGLIEVETPQPTEFVIKGKQKNSYFNFVVQDVDAIHKELNDKGVVTTEIDDFGGMRFFDFFDPDRNPFSVVSEVEGSPFHSDHVKKLQEMNR